MYIDFMANIDHWLSNLETVQKKGAKIAASAILKSISFVVFKQMEKGN